MEDNTHSWFPPSASHRTIACPGSLLRSKEFPDTSNKYSEAGTECHTEMEIAVTMGSPDFNPERFTIDPPRQTELCEKAYATLQNFLNQSQLKVSRTESEVNMGRIGYPDIFGTCDLMIHNPEDRVLAIVDYKFGYNPVDPENNPQLMMYALGALDQYPDVDQVDMCIIQPQITDELLWHSMSVDDLEEWAEKTLIPAINLSQMEDAPLNPGEEQCKYCPVGKNGCAAQVSMYTEALATVDEPRDINTLDDQTLTSLLVKVGAMRDILKHIELAAVNRLKNGSEELAKHFKLVRKGTRRKWESEEEAEKFLRKRLKKADVYTEKVISPSAAEKKLKAHKMRNSTKDEFKALITKPVGELTYATVDDKRPAVIYNRKELLADPSDEIM